MSNKNKNYESKICYVSLSHSKFQEGLEFLKNRNSDIELEHIELEVPEIQTRDHRAIAVGKAESAWKTLKQPLLIDDMGMYLEKYGTFPGTLTKFVFQGIGYRGLFRLVDSGDRAVFIHNLVYIDKDGPDVFESRVEGTIIKPAQLEENQEFPFDQIFVPDGCDRSYDELRTTNLEKYNKFNYRLSAFEKFFSTGRIFSH